MVLADFNLGDALLTVLAIFFFVVWVWILITILTDLFRDHEISGWAKAGWLLVLVLFTPLAALIYLIARGSGMRDRAIRAQAEAQKHFESYVRETAGTSSADELAKLSDLKDKGAISEEEFNRAKARLLD